MQKYYKTKGSNTELQAHHFNLHIAPLRIHIVKNVQREEILISTVLNLCVGLDPEQLVITKLVFNKHTVAYITCITNKHNFFLNARAKVAKQLI